MFHINNAKDILDKIIWERKNINLGVNSKENWFIIMNIIISLYHLLEWTYKDKDSFTEKLRVKCICRFNPYRKKRDQKDKYKKHCSFHTLPELQVNEVQEIIGKMCDDIKHFDKHFVSDSYIKPIYLSTTGDPDMYVGGPNAYCGYYKDIKYVVQNTDHESISVMKVVDELISQWNTFFREIE